jgi:bifunctional DNase/RNase
LRARRRLLVGDGIRRIAIVALVNGVFGARVDFERGAWSPQPRPLLPSDALVLAARQRRPIYVTRRILDEVGLTQDNPEEEE